jgi:hypothetical protein
LDQIRISEIEKMKKKKVMASQSSQANIIIYVPLTVPSPWEKFHLSSNKNSHTLLSAWS